MRILSCLVVEHDWKIVTLAVLICAIGAFVTISLYRRSLDTFDHSRLGWLFLTAVSTGAAIWATHFVAMLGYRTQAAVTFDPLPTILSIIVAIVGSGLGFGIACLSASRPATILGGGLLGLAISGMHYLGMLGYRVGGIVTWSKPLLLASILLSVAFSIAAVHAARRLRTRRLDAVAVPALVVAIASLHFTGMAAFQVTPLLTADPGLSDGAMQALALSAALVGLLVIGTGLSSYLIDDTLRVSSNAQLFRMAFHDALTGLGNRRALEAEMEAAFRDQTWFKLLLIDIDRFKAVNDTFGHATGDRLLVELSAVLRSVIGPSARAFRIGGDELAVTVFKDRQTAMQTASNIVDAFRQPMEVNGHTIVSGCSIGLCAFENAQDGRTLMQRADVALYEAKRRGRNQAFRYEPGMLEAVNERSSLDADLKAAVETMDFTLLYQPVIATGSGRVLGYEALIRWFHPTRGPVSPAQFIPLAEENGCIVSIGRWVLEEACRQAALWPSDVHIAVNVSPVQLNSALFLSHVTQALAKSGLAPSRLEVELTETAMVSDGAGVAHALQALRQLGVKIAMDDFGTGYSSLAHLRDLPLDRIKIDRSFVASAQNDPNSMAVMRAIMQLGRDMGIPTLGEGVETEAQLAILRDLGCDAVQGYLLGRPGTAKGGDATAVAA